MLAAIGDKTVDEGSLLSFTATASDADLAGAGVDVQPGRGGTGGGEHHQRGLVHVDPDGGAGAEHEPGDSPGQRRGGQRKSDDSDRVNEVNQAPVLAAIGDKTVDEGSLLSFTATASDADLPAQALTFSLDAGAPAGASITSGGLFTWTPTEAQGPSTNLVTVRVSDGVTNVNQTIRIVVNEVNQAPVLAAIGDKMVSVGSLLSFTATATDADLPAQVLTFSLDAGAPAGASITSGGLFAWTPTEAQGPSTNLVTVRVSDGVANASQTIRIVVNEVNRAPVLAAIGDKTVDEGSLLSFTATATDADLPAQVLTFSLDAGAPAGASIASGGWFTWTPTEAQGPSTNLVTVRVSDGVTNVNQTIRIVVNEVNQAPVLAAIVDKTVDEGSLLSFTAMATDADVPAQVLTFSLDAGAPAGASIDSGGLFTWTPTEAQGPSTNLVTVRVSDGVANASQTIRIVVNEVNQAPVLAAIGDKTVDEGSLLSFRATATDADVPAQALTFSLDAGAPAGASITSGGLFTWTPTEAQGPSTNLVTVRVSDGVTNASETIRIVVNEVNQAPVLAAIGDKTVDEGSLLSFTAMVTDADVPAQVLTFSLDAGAPAGTSIASGGLFTWTPTEAQGPSTNLVTVRVSDGVTNVNQTIRIVVNEVNQAPVLAAIGDKMVDEGSLLSFTATATDADVPAQALTFSLDAGAPAGTSIASGGLFTWTPTEAQGPSTNLVTVRVRDGVTNVNQTIRIVVNEVNQAPVLAAIVDKTVDEGSLLSFTAMATDADVPAQVLTFSLDAGAPAGASIDSGGLFTWTPTEAQGPSTNLVTVRVSDGVTNASQTIRIVVNEVNQAPVLAAIGDKMVNVGSLLSFTATATDADVPAQVMTFDLDAGAPTGASITSGGLFKWTPTRDQAPSTNLVSVRVSDGLTNAAETIRIIVHDAPSTLTNGLFSWFPLDGSAVEAFGRTAPGLVYGAAPAPDRLGTSNAAYYLNGAARIDIPSFAWPSQTNISIAIWAKPDLPNTGNYQDIISKHSGGGNVQILVRTGPDGRYYCQWDIGSTTWSTPSIGPNGTKFDLLVLTYDGSYIRFYVNTNAASPVRASGMVISNTLPVTLGTKADDHNTEHYKGYLDDLRFYDHALSAIEIVQIYQDLTTGNHAPVLAAIGNQAVNEGSLLMFTASATDSDLPTQTLTFSLGPGAPAGAHTTAAGVFTWTPTEAQGPSTNLVTVRVSDGVTNVSETVQIVVNEVNQRPVLTAQPNRLISALAELVATNTATDPDIPANGLSYQLLNPPPGAVVDAGGVIHWTPDRTQGPSTNVITTVVTDDGVPSLSATNSFLVVVSMPQLASPGNYVVNVGQSVVFTNSATDNDPARKLSISLITAPAEASLTSDSGVFTWRPPVSAAGTTNEIKIQVTDDSLPPVTDSRTFTITVNPLQPVLLIPLSATNGQLQVRVSGMVGPDYILQTSTDLFRWSNLQTSSPAWMPFGFADTNLNSFTNRYYRVRLGP